ncbi:PTS sugar transporter subunit IIA [Conchiformibius kuhniae]|uniref:PTS sugar transporter subunit IIA n=1 Tax=Conchiformibius kuhniae TaxID=211502 RepID=A0A8T9MWE2_9NEIS|nr:PTS mannose transporter subunit IIA [Conchiformibius kuhniae]UOP05569.1 PTS mannose transporter subunit IIA [Conchiformibius kuhniae]
MIGILIITHQTLGAAYRDLARHFFPDHDTWTHVRIVNVGVQDDHDSITARVRAVLPQVDKGHGVLVLTDIFGATPCNAALKLPQPPKLAVLCGLNAPMLVKAAAYSRQHTDLAAFAETVREAAVQGIILDTPQAA